MKNSFYKLLAATGLALTGATTTLAQEERWFEVEVVLFKQLEDKSTLKETFPDEVTDIKRRRFYDIISPALQPSIASLKQTLPRCDGKDSFVDFGLIAPSLAGSLLPPQLQAPYAPVTGAPEKKSLPTANVTVQAKPSIETRLDAQIEVSATEISDNLPIEAPELPPFSLEQALAEISLSDQYDQVFATLDREVDLKIAQEDIFGEVLPAYDTANFKLNWCVSEAELRGQTHPKYGFNLNEIPKGHMPDVLSGVENWDSTVPYLISTDSLQLGYIVQQLRRSREFRPLLHLGWRQATLSKEKAIPIKIVAGDNLKVSFDKLQSQRELSYNSLFQLPKSGEAVVDPMQAQLNTIIDNALMRNFSAESVLTDARIGVTPSTQDVINTGLIDVPLPQNLIEPLQEYWLDGFMTIHLNHYLFISGEFNFYENEQVSFDNKIPTKRIKFHQDDRRVISEQIHYFDHPHIGMVVQIRKIKKPEPEPEAELVSESDSIALTR